MTDNINQKIRWEQLLRYQLIEVMALWEGRLITNHLMGAFGIGRQQASKDIKAYREHCPNNLEYNKKIKGYVPTPLYKAQYTKGTANEYLHLLNSNKALSPIFENSQMPISYTKVLTVPNRTISPEILRPIIKACREKLRLDITYCSMTSPEGEDRIISPHSIIFSGVRWHVRAYCEKHRDYRDFVINRISSIDDEMGEAITDDKADALWHKMVQIQICPNPNLNTAQQALIARDYNMYDDMLILTERAALTHYALDHLQVYSGELSSNNLELLVVKNLDEVMTYIN